ncbi:MAG: hypothetical protein ACD_39C00990G0002, partial [uncultured bacterium]
MPRKPSFFKKSVFGAGILILTALLLISGCCNQEQKG